MPTFPYSHAPTFVEEAEQNYMVVPVVDTFELEVSKFHFVPYANTSIAFAIEQIFDFPKHANTLFVAPNEHKIKFDSGVHVITTFFRGTYSMARVRELLSSMVSNLENPHIEAVHILWEEHDPREFIPVELLTKIPNVNNKLVLTYVEHQPTYRELFGYANMKLKRGAIAIITK
jgi:hypothetical protein